MFPVASLAALQATDVDRFFSAVLRNVDEFVPVVYTPGVGAACQNWGYLPAEPQSMILSLDHRGEIEAILRAWADRHSTPKAIVVTDGERYRRKTFYCVLFCQLGVCLTDLYTHSHAPHRTTEFSDWAILECGEWAFPWANSTCTLHWRAFRPGASSQLCLMSAQTPNRSKTIPKYPKQNKII